MSKNIHPFPIATQSLKGEGYREGAFSYKIPQKILLRAKKSGPKI